jgi:hypothetical protein
MSGFFFNLGRRVGSTMKQGNWLIESLTGSEADVLKAEQDVGEGRAHHALQMPPGRRPRGGPLPQRVRALLAGPRVLAACGQARTRTRQPHLPLPGPADQGGQRVRPAGRVRVATLRCWNCATGTREVSFVLGHEMGHVLHGHAMQRHAGIARQHRGPADAVARTRRRAGLLAGGRTGAQAYRAIRNSTRICWACGWSTAPASTRAGRPGCWRGWRLSPRRPIPHGLLRDASAV